jgi:hypothetical protein
MKEPWPKPGEAWPRATLELPLLESASVSWLTRCLNSAELGEPDPYDSPDAFRETLRDLLLRTFEQFPAEPSDRWRWLMGQYPWGDQHPVGAEHLAASPINLGFACFPVMDVVPRRHLAQRAFVGLLLHVRRRVAESDLEGASALLWGPAWGRLAREFIALPGIEPDVAALDEDLRRYPDRVGRQEEWEKFLERFYALVDANPSASSAAVDSGPGIRLEDAGLYSPATLAEALGLEQDFVEARLTRWRHANMGSTAWIEVTERKPREPKYLYRAAAVRSLLQEPSRRASRERPAKS